MTIKAKHESSLLQLLLESFPESNRTRLKKAIQIGCISVQGAVVKHAEFVVRAGQIIDYQKNKSIRPSEEKAPFKIVFEDPYFLIAEKPPGILSMGRTTEKTRSMFSMVQKYVKNKSKDKENVYTIHRLDREVSGLMIFAKTEEVQILFKENWGEVAKDYYALVEGIPSRPKGVLKNWLKEDGKQRMYVCEKEEEDAKWAVTHYQTLKTFSRTALLNVGLETGRKNQIRIQLSHIGHPIVGDRKYGADDFYKRQIRLFAYKLSFRHPITRSKLCVELPLPKFFCELKELHEHY